MKKSTWIKRAVATFLVVLMSIESIAAVVGDNDGAAFITKAEFESLRNDFQSQINRYNTSLDDKINGAIANYISGIRISPTSSIPLPLLDWGEVTCFNKPFVNTFTYPSLNLFAIKPYVTAHFGTSGRFHDYVGKYYDTYGDEWHMGNVWINATYNNSAVVKKALVTGVKESETTFANHKPTWGGVTEGWKTSIDIAASGTAGDNNYAIEVNHSTYPPGFLFSNAAIFLEKQNFTTADQIYGGTWAYFQAYAASPQWSKYIYSIQDTFGLFKSATCLITKTDPKWEHIISYTNTDDWHVYSDTWTKSLKIDTNNTLTCDNYFSQWSGAVSGRFNYTKVQPGASYYVRTTNADGTYTYSYPGLTPIRNTILITEPVQANNKTVAQADQSSVKLPDVGYVGEFTPDEIYQIDASKKLQQYLDANLYELNAPKLNQGFVLGYAKAGDEITWTPYFTTRHWGSHTSVLNNNNAVRVWISTVPFTNTYLPSGNLIQTENESGVKATVQSTRYDGSDWSHSYRKIKWKMQNDGWIYVKWAPTNSDTYILNTAWDVTLDLTKCGFYLRTTES